MTTYEQSLLDALSELRRKPGHAALFTSFERDFVAALEQLGPEVQLSRRQQAKLEQLFNQMFRTTLPGGAR